MCDRALSGTPSHISWPHQSDGEPHRITQWQESHACSNSFWHALHTFRVTIRSSTEGSGGSAPRPPRRPCRHTPHEDRGPTGSSRKAPQWHGSHAAAPTNSAPSISQRIAYERVSVLRYSELHMVGFFAWLNSVAERQPMAQPTRGSVIPSNPVVLGPRFESAAP